jgi:hypothetical protein
VENKTINTNKVQQGSRVYKKAQPPLFFKPGNDLESKAIFLEETLFNMSEHSDYLYRKIKMLEKRGKPTEELKEKRKSVVKGVNEVFEKCNIIWDKIINSNNT